MHPAPLPLAALAALLLPGSAALAQAVPEVDRARLAADLSALAHDSLAGRAPGTAGSAAARRIVVRGFREAGARPLGDRYEHPFEHTGVRGVNVVARVAGTDQPDRWIVVTAHYDHLGTRNGVIHNGADDNASGTAALVALARALAERAPRHGVLLVAFDQEEVGLRGARAFVAEPPVALERVVLNVNMDMISRTGGVLWAAGAHHTPSLRPVLERIAARAPVRLRLGHDRPGAPEGDDWTSASDHGPFHAAGIPFVYFGVEDHPDYHRPTDDFEHVDTAAYADAVTTIVRAFYALDAALIRAGGARTPGGSRP